MDDRLAARPRLLLLTHRFPYPPNRGDRIRSYHLLHVLSKHFRVTLGCTADEPVAEIDYEHIQTFCESIFAVELERGGRILQAIKAFALGKSVTEGAFASLALRKQVDQWHRDDPFDAVLVFCSSMFPYVENERFRHVRTIVDLVDVDSQKWAQMGRESGIFKNWLYRLESRRVQKLEQRIADRADGVALVSHQEALLFAQTVSVSCPVAGISNGVDTSYFTPRELSISDPHVPSFRIKPPNAARNRFGADAKVIRRDRSLSSLRSSAPNSSAAVASVPRPLKLVFTGVLDYSPNVEGINWFCRQILPRLRQLIPVELTIVGRRPDTRIESLRTLKGVNVVGEVPDVRPYLRHADIAISPLKLARGIQNKVLEAMASGLPVVLTSQSAEGIDARSGVQFVIADAAEEWCQALVHLSHDPSFRNEMGHAARRLVSSEYAWPRRLSEFVTLLKPPGPAREGQSSERL